MTFPSAGKSQHTSRRTTPRIAVSGGRTSEPGRGETITGREGFHPAQSGHRRGPLSSSPGGGNGACRGPAALEVYACVRRKCKKTHGTKAEKSEGTKCWRGTGRACGRQRKDSGLSWPPKELEGAALRVTREGPRRSRRRGKGIGPLLPWPSEAAKRRHAKSPSQAPTPAPGPCPG